MIFEDAVLVARTRPVYMEAGMLVILVRELKIPAVPLLFASSK